MKGYELFFKSHEFEEIKQGFCPRNFGLDDYEDNQNGCDSDGCDNCWMKALNKEYKENEDE